MESGEDVPAGWKAEKVVAGMAGPLQALRELLLWPLLYAEEAKTLGLLVIFLLLRPLFCCWALASMV